MKAEIVKEKLTDGSFVYSVVFKLEFSKKKVVIYAGSERNAVCLAAELKNAVGCSKGV